MLFERHARAVYAFCARRTADLALAEDLTSIVFLEAWRRRERTEIRGESLLPWLLGIAHNAVRNAHRSRRRHRAALARLPPEPLEAAADDVASRIDAERALADALQAIRTLPDRERDVVVLVLWSGLSYEDAALALGVPAGTVRSRLSRAPCAPQRFAGQPLPFDSWSPRMIDPTSVPVPSDAWVAARRDHLLAELRRAPERRVHRRLVGGMGALAAAGAATAAGLLIAGGPAASTAFAGWRAAPTAPAPGQLPAAKASCGPAGGPSAGGKVGAPGAVPSGPPALSDVRGPYSMLLYLDGDGRSTLCMSGGFFVRVLSRPAPTAPAPPADGLVIDHLASGAVTFVEGRVGSAVTGAGLTLDDGTQVTVTVGRGHFIAWWPGSEAVATSTETTASGSQSGPADAATGAMRHPCPSGTAPCNHVVHRLDGSAPAPHKGG